MTRSLWLTVIAGVLPSSVACGQEQATAGKTDVTSASGSSESAVPPANRKLTAELKIAGYATTAADFDGDNGDVQTSSVGANFEIGIPLAQRSTLTLGLGTEWSFYDFGGDSGFGASDPWDTISEYTASGRYSLQLDETWSWFLGGFAASSGEQGADFSETITGGGFTGFGYAPSREFFIAFGAGYATRLEDDGYVIPAIILRWQINDKWSLATDTETRGAGLQVSYQLTESLALTAAGGFLFKEFRLDEDGAVPSGVGIERGFPVALGARWKVSDQVTFNTRLGVILGREMKLEDDSGNELQELDVDTTPFLSANLTFTF
jgi:hypothetical protein